MTDTSSQHSARDRYVKGPRIGHGAFKTVYSAIDRERGIEVAWNEIQLDGDVNLQKLEGEINLLSQLESEYIMSFYESWVDEEKMILVFITELMTSGSLRSFVQKAKSVAIPVIRNWCRQILRGLQHLHSRSPPVVHRDIKLDNIFFHGTMGQVKIGDLGLATIANRTQKLSVIGTPEFMAPEFYNERYNEKVDIWAFGLALLEMTTLEYPYSECTNVASVFRTVSTGLKPLVLAKIDNPETFEFICCCLEFDTDLRLSAEELLRHPWLQSEETTDPESRPLFVRLREPEEFKAIVDRIGGTAQGWAEFIDEIITPLRSGEAYRPLFVNRRIQTSLPPLLANAAPTNRKPTPEPETDHPSTPPIPATSPSPSTPPGPSESIPTPGTRVGLDSFVSPRDSASSPSGDIAIVDEEDTDIIARRRAFSESLTKPVSESMLQAPPSPVRAQTLTSPQSPRRNHVNDDEHYLDPTGMAALYPGGPDSPPRHLRSPSDLGDVIIDSPWPPALQGHTNSTSLQDTQSITSKRRKTRPRLPVRSDLLRGLAEGHDSDDEGGGSEDEVIRTHPLSSDEDEPLEEFSLDGEEDEVIFDPSIPPRTLSPTPPLNLAATLHLPGRDSGSDGSDKVISARGLPETFSLRARAPLGRSRSGDDEVIVEPSGEDPSIAPVGSLPRRFPITSPSLLRRSQSFTQEDNPLTLDAPDIRTSPQPSPSPQRLRPPRSPRRESHESDSDKEDQVIHDQPVTPPSLPTAVVTTNDNITQPALVSPTGSPTKRRNLSGRSLTRSFRPASTDALLPLPPPPGSGLELKINVFIPDIGEQRSFLFGYDPSEDTPESVAHELADLLQIPEEFCPQIVGLVNQQLEAQRPTSAPVSGKQASPSSSPASRTKFGPDTPGASASGSSGSPSKGIPIDLRTLTELDDVVLHSARSHGPDTPSPAPSSGPTRAADPAALLRATHEAEWRQLEEQRLALERRQAEERAALLRTHQRDSSDPGVTPRALNRFPTMSAAPQGSSDNVAPNASRLKGSFSQSVPTYTQLTSLPGASAIVPGGPAYSKPASTMEEPRLFGTSPGRSQIPWSNSPGRPSPLTSITSLPPSPVNPSPLSYASATASTSSAPAPTSSASS